MGPGGNDQKSDAEASGGQKQVLLRDRRLDRVLCRCSRTSWIWNRLGAMSLQPLTIDDRIEGWEARKGERCKSIPIWRYATDTRVEHDVLRVVDIEATLGEGILATQLPVLVDGLPLCQERRRDPSAFGLANFNHASARLRRLRHTYHMTFGNHFHIENESMIEAK